MYKKQKDQLHFVGIGGIGMSGIAEVLLRLGFPVSGSDLAESESTLKLKKLGAKVYQGHSPSNLKDAKVVVHSSAIQKDNPEIVEAMRLELPLVSRAEMLAELMRLKFGVAVAGTHGKTTTTSFLGSMLAAAEADPTVIVGGKVDVLGGNAKVGEGQFLIAEADESDGSFLSLSPVVNIITNIDNDHMDYYGSVEKLRMAFLTFINKIPYYGRTILCVDNPEIQKLIPLVERPMWTYGFSKDADFRIENFKPETLGSRFSVYRESNKLCDIQLRLPGEHNARNATGALAAALELDFDLDKVLQGIKTFTGVRRRFEVKGEWNKVTIVDDYGHHPTEIEATVSAAKSFWDGRVIVAFQPHRFTRTQACWNEFGQPLKNADRVYLLDVYPAGESQIPGIDSKNLAKKISEHSTCEYVGSLEDAPERIQSSLRPGDLLITLGAGSITKLGPMLLNR